MITQNDLLDLHRVFCFMRMDPSFPENKQILQIIRRELHQPLKDENKFREALSELDLQQSERWDRFVRHLNDYPYHVFIKDPLIYETLDQALQCLLKCLEDGAEERFVAVANALHNLPVMICENHYKIPKRFFRNEVRDIRKNWDRDFLKNSLKGALPSIRGLQA